MKGGEEESGGDFGLACEKGKKISGVGILDAMYFFLFFFFCRHFLFQPQ